MFLLDTNAITEIDLPKPNHGFVDWLASVDWNDLYLSVISIAEIRQGIGRMPTGKRRREIEANFELLSDRFPNRIVSFDYPSAVKYGEIQSEVGPLPALDTMIAATALVNRLTLVTRDTGDFGRTGVAILDPWT